jgi:hypothetical protein
MSKRLRLGPGLTLPLDAVTRAICFTGQRGTGKSSSAVVLVEEASAAGAPSVIIDPTDVWYGLATSADGKGPGLGHIIFGGLHGHLPLRADAGAVMARLVVEQRLAAVFSIKHLRKGEQLRFVAEFMEELYHHNSEALLVVIDEAHRFAPRVQMEKGGYAQRCLGAVTDIATLGRANGLGIALVTQRMARLHTDVREACEVMVIKRLVGPNDRKAIVEWLADAGAEGEAMHLLAMLPKLPLDKALVYAPGLDILGEFAIRMKHTFDSSGTPEVGAAKVEPRSAADVDLSAIEAQIGETIEQARQDDPKHLRARITQLERELAKTSAETPAEPVEVEVEVEVPAVPAGLLGDLAQTRTDLTRAAEYLAAAISRTEDGEGSVEQLAREGFRVQGDAARGAPATTKGVQTAAAPARPAEGDRTRARGSNGDRRAPSSLSSGSGNAVGAGGARAQPASSNGDAPLGKAERRILSVLAQFPQGRSMAQLAMLTGYSVKSGGLRNALGALRSAGLVDRNQPIGITEDGFAAIDGAYEALPQGAALFDYWLGKMGKAEREILHALRARGEQSIDELAESTGYSPTSGGLRNALGKLRTLELVEPRQPISLTPEFAGVIE